MIIDLHKYLLVGTQADMDRFFMLAQRGGFLEFIGLSKKKALEMPQEAKTVLAAIKIARAHIGSNDASYDTDLSPIQLAEQIVHWNESRERLLEQERIFQAEIARIHAFGNFSREELDQLEVEGKRVFQFFCMKSDLAREMTLPSEVIYVGTEYDLDYFVSINKEKTQYSKMIEILIEKPVGDLRKELHDVKLELTKLEQDIRESARALPYLQSGLFDCLNVFHLELAKHDAALHLSSLFAIEAWVPKTKIKALYGLLSNLDVFAEEIAIEEKDRIPTYQENKGVGKIGEDLVLVYDIPASTDADPSLWVLVFFALFFAMIVSDAGYGLIYMGIGLFLKYKFKNAVGLLRRFIKLIFICSTACLIWGIATASFFGIEIGPNNPFREMSFLNYLATKKAEYHLEKKDDVYEEYLKEFPLVSEAKTPKEFFLAAKKEVEGKVSYEARSTFTDDILLELSLFIGVIHISLSFIRYIRRNWTGIAWIFFMVGGYLYFPFFLNATSFVNFLGWVSKPIAYAVGSQLLYIGLVLVLFISLLQRKKWGALHELTNAIQVFADVLSYLRLYALSLAGMIMASTFNDLGMRVGIFGGFFVILIGHMTNLSLTVMSGVIHGLRLNFLEWYHYSFEGGGRLFDPLRIRKLINFRS